MDLKLKDKIAFISGSTAGIGFAIAKRLLDEGARVIINGRTKEQNFFKNNRPTSLLQRFASVEEIADTVVYFVSPLASAANGAAIRAEGGLIKSIL